MRAIGDLIDREEPGWKLVSEWIKEATNRVETLPKDEQRASDALFQTQVTTRSPMGAIIYETGGILIDNGWIRILGSGDKKLERTLPNWNRGRTFKEYGEEPPFLLIADDVVGGFFAINGGALGDDLGKVYYFAPDTMAWEPMDVGYSNFLWWTFAGDLSRFYADIRWTNYSEDINELNGDQGYLLYNGDYLNRKIVPISEVWGLQQDIVNQL